MVLTKRVRLMVPSSWSGRYIAFKIRIQKENIFSGKNTINKQQQKFTTKVPLDGNSLPKLK